MEKFERADPNALADFDPRTKVCTMNCGPTVGDPRSPEERRFLCPDCVTVPVPSRNRANDLFSALLEFHNAFCNRDETTSLHVWNERMKSADENAVAVLNAAPHSSQPDTVAVPMTWIAGAPPKPWCNEWFIAKTTFGDRVVLKALPEEYTYDFKTADDTYIKADKIVCWMQFPDSEYIEAAQEAK